MNCNETTKILSVLKAAYPTSYRDMTENDAAAAVKLWASMFIDKPYDLVAAAVKSLIATSKWVPTIAEVNTQIQKLTQPSALDEMEAWELVRKAISNGIYGSKEEFDKLPPIIQKSVGSHNQLREWAVMDTQTVQSVGQSNFMRTYRAKAEKQKEYDMFPASIQTMLASVATQIKTLPEVTP